MTIRSDRRSTARRKVAAAARISALFDAPVATPPWESVADSIGVSPRAIRVLFRDADDLLDELNEQLVDEIAMRLRMVDVTPTDGTGADPEQAVGLLVDGVVRTRPLDRSSLVVRFARRGRALSGPGRDPSTSRAEGRFLTVLSDEIVRLLMAIGREPTLPADDISRVFLNCYERAFEAWLVDGNDEGGFAESRFVGETLPGLILALSRPAGPAPSPS